MYKIKVLNDYAIHYAIDDLSVSFSVHPIVHWEGLDGDKGFYYIDKEKEPETIAKFDVNKCLNKLEGCVRWRGVFDSRLYFPDVEYWGEDLKQLSNLYDNYILPFCKKIIYENNNNNM